VRSPLAEQVVGVRDPGLATDRGAPWGVLLHTTGRGVPARAAAEKRRVVAVAIEVYIDSQNGANGYYWGGPHYVLDHDGKSYQIAPENALAAHAGGGNRSAYIAGYWTSKCSGAALAAWRKQWPTYRHPYSLFPSKTPNRDFVGIEMIPVGSGFGVPMRPGLLFTKEQHDSVAVLCADIAARHAWPDGWHRTPRLLGHEDVDLLERMDSRGGWDPGWLRREPYFDFEYVRNAIG